MSEPTHIINGLGDLYFLHEMRPYIRTKVTFVKVCKSGLIQVRAEDGKLLSVAKFNLDEITPSPEKVVVRESSAET